MNTLLLALVHCWREWSRHPLAALLNLFGIAIGVALFVAIQTANHSALQSFRASVDLVAGRANLQVVSAAGTRLAEQAVLPVLWQEPGIANATPVFEQIIMLPDYPGEYLRLVGVDIFCSQDFRTWQIRPARGVQADLEDFLIVPGTVAIQESLASRLGIEPGGTLRWRALGRGGDMQVLFTLEREADAVGADEHLAVVDVSTIQEMLGFQGKLDRVDALLAAGAKEEEVLNRVNKLLPAGLIAQRPERRNRQVELMIGAFQLNLTALSLIALMVGAFLVFNTMANSVVRRREEIGLLRAVGASRPQIRGIILLEAAVLGCLGGLLGLLLGKLLATVLVGAVSRTISSLYILLSIRELFISGWALLGGLLLGILTAVFAAWIPAREASLVSPREALWPGNLMEKTVQAGAIWLWRGLVLLVLAIVTAHLSLNTGPDWLSFVSAALTLLGFAVMAPWISSRMVAIIASGNRTQNAEIRTGYPRRDNILWRMITGHFRSGLHRNAVAVAALSSAVALIVGLGVMVYSFRETVNQWILGSVRADVFVAPVSNLITPGAEFLPEETIAIVQSQPGTQAYDMYREIRFDYQGRPTRLAAVNFLVMGQYSPLPIPGAHSGTTIRNAAVDGEILVSEPFSRRFGKHTGDTLTIFTPIGARDFRIAAVFTDYTTDQGLILMHWPQFVKLWQSELPQSLALYLEPGISSEEVIKQLRQRLSNAGDYLIYSNEKLRKEVLRIFDQTFSVTGVLQAIGMLVAAVGVFLTATLLAVERRREMGVLCAIGFSRSQLAQILRGESMLIGLAGGTIGIACGLCLAILLMRVINVAFFGWTVSWATPWALLLLIIPCSMAGCWLAAWYPAQQAASLQIAHAVRAE